MKTTCKRISNREEIKKTDQAQNTMNISKISKMRYRKKKKRTNDAKY